jgi:hypothetical protein
MGTPSTYQPSLTSGVGFREQVVYCTSMKEIQQEALFSLIKIRTILLIPNNFFPDQIATVLYASTAFHSKSFPGEDWLLSN